MRIYLDTAPVIYAVEHGPPYAAFVDARLSPEDVERVASDLTRLECRVKPLRDGNADLLKDFDDFFDRRLTEIVGLSTAVIVMPPRFEPATGSELPTQFILPPQCRPNAMFF